MELEQIKKLLDLDEKTRKEVAAAHEEKNQLLAKIAVEEQRLSKEAWDKVNETLEQKEKDMVQEAADEKKRLELNFTANKKKLEKQFLEHREEWITMLIKRVTSLEEDHE
ncbi:MULTISPECIES: hypothetical protein [Terrabacteria group]|uniref:hypothetical protein n=1 Tax=Bacillati TaxID=1783272 RepID=UPI001C6EFCB8|nr:MULTISPECIES: hypothetical protein [Terrabacteria group]MBW9212313.1 hypothetical protein [Trueperella sp. zg.1013]